MAIYTVYRHCITMAGYPSLNILLESCSTLSAAGIFIHAFTPVIKQAANCPATVAMAAPAIPSSGNGPIPNISTGSSTIFTTAPVISAAMGLFMSPPA